MERLTARYNGHAVMAWEHENKYTTEEWIDMLTARLAAYEDTGLEPEEVETLKTGTCLGCSVPELKEGQALHKEWEEAYQEGRLVVLDEETALAMCAGARAIEQSKRFWGATYCWDVFGKCGGPKELSYYEAANKLRCLAERALEGQK